MKGERWHLFLTSYHYSHMAVLLQEKNKNNLCEWVDHKLSLLEIISTYF